MIFNTLFDLDVHVESLSCRNLHTWRCNYCTKKLASKRGYRRHLMCIHGIKINRRIATGKNLRIPGSEDEMLIKLHPKQNYNMLKNCDFCSKKFSTRKCLTEHILTHLSEGESSCYSCKMIFNTLFDLDVHVESLSCRNLHTWRCNYCTKKLASKRGYRRHLMCIHGIKITGRIATEKNLRITGSEDEMLIKLHPKQNYNMLKNCDFCSKKFSTRKCLSEHILTHLSEGESSCYSCELTFNTLFDLNVHVESLSCRNLHTWQCNYCTKELASKRGYRRHLMRIHKVKLTSCIASRALLLADRLLNKTTTTTMKSVRKHKNVSEHFGGNVYTQKHKLILHLGSHELQPEKALCNVSKNQRFTLSRHYQKKAFQRMICENSFYSRYNCRHMKTNHNWRRYKNITVKSQKLRLTCNKCNLPCANMYRLRLHMLKKHNVEVPKYKCRKCDSSFLHRRKLEKHMKVAHASGDFMCEICGASFTDFIKLKYHIVQHQFDHFSCQVCRKSFQHKSKLNNHVFWEHISPILPHTAWEFWKPDTDVLILECDFCDDTFTSELQLEKHTLEHLKQSKTLTERGGDSIDAEMCELLDINGPLRKFFPCFACIEEFTQFSDLNKHISIAHKDAQQMQCKLCDKSYTKKNGYISHLQKSHLLNPGLKLQCPYCSNVLLNPTHFARHFGGSLPPGLNVTDCCVSNTVKKKLRYKQITHSCDFCENVYTGAAGLAKHVRDYHPEEWKYKCQFCDKKFLQFCKNMKHEYRFHREKHTCPYCKIALSKQKDLIQHILEFHDGKPAFLCEKCGLEFPSRHALQNHESKHSSIQFNAHKAQISIESETSGQELLDHPNNFPLSTQESATNTDMICQPCNIHFSSINEMNIHIYTYHQKINCYSCIECGAAFHKIHSLEHHMQSLHAQDKSKSIKYKVAGKKTNIGVTQIKKNFKIYECKKCGRQFQMYKVYFKHVSNCATDGLCQGCGKSQKYFKNQTIMSEHEANCKLTPHPYKCSKCTLKFVSMHFLQKHEREHNLCWADRMTCSHCPLGFASIAEVLEHYTKNHMNQLPFPLFCKHCDFNCDNMVELKLHATQHNQQMVHCNQCHRDVSVPQFKRTHILACKTTICSICSMECGSVANLFLHVQQDHETGNHSCLLCLNSFPSESNLQQHVTHNHGQVPFNCDICKVNISYKENLRSHIKLHIHSTTRCRICGREFAVSFNVYQHILKEHKNLIPPHLLGALCDLG